MRPRARDLGFRPVVPHPHRKQPWTYDAELYKQRHEVARVFTRYDKRDVMYGTFALLAFIVKALRDR